MRFSIAMYHNTPPVPEISETGRRVWMKHVWDPHMIAEATGLDYDSQEFHDAYWRVLEPYPLPEEQLVDMDVYVFDGTEEVLRQVADVWAREIRNELPNVGGDDSHYDYFPDYVNGFYYLCAAINYPEAYNETLALVHDSDSYRNDPETEDLFNGRLKEAVS